MPGLGTTPPAAGTPSATASNGAIADYANQYGVTLGSTPAGGSSSGGQQNFPYLYGGANDYTASSSSSANAAENGVSNPDKYSTVLSSQDAFMKSGNTNIRHWALLLALAGYAGGGVTNKQAIAFAKTASLDEVYQAHLQFLNDAANWYGAGHKQTPQDYLKQRLDYRMGKDWDGKLSSVTLDAVGKGLGGESLAGTKTSTSKSVDIMSAEDAKGMVRTMLQQELGRDPTAQEYEDFVATIQNEQSSHPSYTTTTTTTDTDGDVTNQSSKSTGGITSTGLSNAVDDQLHQTASWKEWQAMGTYAPALYAALGAPV